MQNDPDRETEVWYEEDDSLPRRRGGIDLTSTGFRIGATLAVLALTLLLIYMIVRPGAGEQALDDVPTVVATLTGQTSQTLATFTPGATSTPPPLDQPTEAPSSDDGGLRLNGSARVTGTGGAGVNMRDAASTSAGIVQILGDDTPLTLTEGPVEADGFTWWKVRLDDGTEGWVVQDFLTP